MPLGTSRAGQGRVRCRRLEHRFIRFRIASTSGWRLTSRTVQLVCCSVISPFRSIIISSSRAGSRRKVRPVRKVHRAALLVHVRWLGGSDFDFSVLFSIP